ncbi:MAG: OadG family protein [Saprospirales bacterium]|nr:OadG family protein [Saprospirales bacterium]MBK8492460.1 OadG family protein [Saprospirales bacterium]
MHPVLVDGLILMVVGMLTVFIALGLVVAIGHGLILIVNRFPPPLPLPAYPESEPISGAYPASAELDNAKLAVILAGVEAATGGKGRVVQIMKSQG